jgi:hypothetical protein
LKAEPWRERPWWSGSSRPVFRFTVRDDEGRTRAGRAWCGGFFRGVESRKIAVVWDEPPAKHAPPAPRPEAADPLWDDDVDRGPAPRRPRDGGKSGRSRLT